MSYDDAVWGEGRRESEYVDCIFDDATFSSVAPGNARFVRCSFRNARIHDFFASNVELVDCVFTGRIDKGVFNGTRDATRLGILGRLFGRKLNEITGNDFSQCELADVGFRSGIDLGLQQLPAGPDYLFVPDAALAVQTGRAAIAAWPADETRRLAAVLLDIMETDLAGGQRQQFYRVPERGHFATPWDRLRVALANGASPTP